MIDWSMNEKAIAAGHKPYDPESEWQPVRIAPNRPGVHPMAIPGKQHLWDSLWAGKIVRVKPGNLNEQLVRIQYAQWVGCDAKQFYDVHPDDVDVFLPMRAQEGFFLCEHQIQAD